MSRRRLTTTSFAILGLLAVRPWATYDLAKLMRRSLHFFWPRAESNLYAEPKRLVAAGLAEAREEWNGDRRRTVYSITDRGREALREWLSTPPADARVESEAHLRLLYANYGSKDDLLSAIQSIEDDAQRTIDHYTRLLTEYARGEGLFPERIHVNALLGSLSIEQARAAVRWARWAREAVAAWKTTAEPDVEWAAETMLRAAGETDGA
jgi:PadR family transcriptional regulator, regulatory protein AphA